MDVESIHSTNSHRSHNKNLVVKNGTDYALQPYQIYESQLYGCSMNNNTYPNNIIPVYNTAFYPSNFQMPPNSFNSAPISTNMCFNNNPPQSNGGYIPVSVLQNNGYGDFNNMIGKAINTDFNTGEKIQVQILPQDDNWGADTCTAITSDTGGSMENIAGLTGMANHVSSKRPRLDCMRIIGNSIFIILCVLAIVSPVAMLVLPNLKWLEWEISTCNPACEGQLISLISKLVILIIGTWALFFRRKQYSVTRVSVFRALILFIAFVIVFAYWLFYSVRILDKKFKDFYSIVLFAVSLVDTLLFVHYLGLVMLEVYQMQMFFYIKVTRSPDGISRFYRVGRLSIQSAAIFVLQNYVTDFPEYNYDLVQCMKRKCYKRYQARQNHGSNHNTPNDTPDKKTKYKVYNIDAELNPHENDNNNNNNNNSNNHNNNNNSNSNNISNNISGNLISNQNAMKGGTGTSARLYEESEWEKKFRKRQMRLLVAVEEAFSHVHITEGGDDLRGDDQMRNMGVLEAAQTILPAIIKPLQKLLRVSRRHMSYSSSIVISHIAQCLSHRLSPKYLVRQFSPSVTVMDSLLLSDAKSNEKLNKIRTEVHLSWVVICSRLLSKGLNDNVVFQLKPRDCHVEDLCLMCTVHKVPFFSLEEKIFNESDCRFTLHTNSETSV